MARLRRWPIHGVSAALALAFVLALAPLSAAAAQPGEPVRILFIGNSYTYENKLPLTLVSLAASAQEAVRIETAEVLVGGASLQRHWTKGDALEAIRKGGWDWVVLQDHSLLDGVGFDVGGATIPGRPELLYEFARLFNAEIRKTKARTLFYLTWSREFSPEGQARLTESYRSIAKELSAAVAPVGIAFQNARIARPALSLYQADHSHPSDAGTYLAACVFYAVITGRNPGGLTAVIADERHKSDEPLEMIRLSPEDAAFAQRVAWRTVLADPFLADRLPKTAASPGPPASR